MAIANRPTSPSDQFSTRNTPSDSPPQIICSITPQTGRGSGSADTLEGRKEVLEWEPSKAATLSATHPSSITRQEKIQTAKPTNGATDGPPAEKHASLAQDGLGAGSHPEHIDNTTPVLESAGTPSGHGRLHVVISRTWKAAKKGIRRILLGSTEEDFTRTIQVAVMVGNEERVLVAVAKFDSGNPYDHMSSAFAQKFDQIFDPADAEEILELPGGNKLYSAGKVPARWAPYGEKKVVDRKLHFYKRFRDTTFEVSAFDNEKYDIIIGENTIKREGLMKLKLKIGWTGWGIRKTRAPEEQAVIDAAAEEQKRAQAENKANKATNEKERKKREEERRKRDES